MTTMTNAGAAGLRRQPLVNAAFLAIAAMAVLPGPAAASDCLAGIEQWPVLDPSAKLTAYALQRLAQVEGLRIYGDAEPQRVAQRLGVIPFNLASQSHSLVAAVLGAEHGVGVRNGRSCAHHYLTHLLGLTQADVERVRAQMAAGDRSQMPGMVRVSFGLYNTAAEVGLLVDAVGAIARGEWAGRSVPNRASGEFESRPAPVHALARTRTHAEIARHARTA